MLEAGLLLFFLVPGLLTYCAIYGLFHSGKAIAPQPPDVNSIEAVTVIFLCSTVVHASTAVLIDLNSWLCSAQSCSLTLPSGLLDPYARAFQAIDGKGVTGHALGGLLGAALLQGIVAYIGVRLYLRRLALADRLPSWIYGWATDIANAVDNDDVLVVAYVLTNHDLGGRPIVYGGVLYDMALKSDGAISRLTLWDCERYLADLGGTIDQPTLPVPSSRFQFMMIEASQIRNVAFEIVDLADLATTEATSARVEPG